MTLKLAEKKEKKEKTRREPRVLRSEKQKYLIIKGDLKILKGMDLKKFKDECINYDDLSDEQKLRADLLVVTDYIRRCNDWVQKGYDDIEQQYLERIISQDEYDKEKGMLQNKHSRMLVPPEKEKRELLKKLKGYKI